ncbi:GNAT family N-acetyltransferase [Halobacillus litoralis]|uniref:GNAT family N-acetyltransferase n=1 Tax=Halobacillus litoralis TaxID=45668 RepID=UPI001CD5D0EC|nr:GNAT family N-acetyltransferase [Halobacillus litoralis]MCA0972422.1 GNAT family N-acetyltransferase [Halobacillus litoralis]
MGRTDEFRFKTKDQRYVLIRTAVAEDAEQVLDLTNEVIRTSAYLLTTEEEFKLSVETERDLLDSLLVSEGSLALVAECEGEIAGFLDFHNGRKKRNKHQGSFGMSVLPAYRGHGIGKALLQQLMHWAEGSPLIEKVSLEVFSKNRPAISLYEREGFIEEGRKREAVKLGESLYDDLLIMARSTK